MKVVVDKQFTKDSGTTSERQKDIILQLTIYWTFFSCNKKEIKTCL